MTKTELIDAIAKDTNLSKKDVAATLVSFTDTVTGALEKGERVQLVGFGTFEVTKRNERTARNPQTGETMKVKASKSPKFKAGKSLKDAVNSSK